MEAEGSNPLLIDYNKGAAVVVYLCFAQDLMFGSRGFESFVDVLQQSCRSWSVPMVCPRANVWKQRVRIQVWLDSDKVRWSPVHCSCTLFVNFAKKSYKYFPFSTLIKCTWYINETETQIANNYNKRRNIQNSYFDRNIGNVNKEYKKGRK